MSDVQSIIERYTKKLNGQVNSFNNEYDDSVKMDYTSKEFKEFKKDMMPELSNYEKWARSIGGMIKIKLAQKDMLKIQNELDSAHLDVSPSEVVGLATFGFLMMNFLGFVIGVIIWALTSDASLDSLILEFPYLLMALIFFSSMFFFYYFYSMPTRLATRWKLKAGSQMVPAILYLVIYMKHTSNLERAMGFVAKHIQAPLSLDLKKVLWEVEIGKYPTIKEGIDHYLEFWSKSTPEFVESFHLIESSLYEPNDVRRVQILERSLQVILEGVYERMLKYTHSIKTPLTNIYMLGIVLPTLGLALLPLASTLLGGSLQWHHVFLMFNFLIPFLVFYLTMNIMLNRPGGYGEAQMIEKTPLYYKYTSRKPYLIAGLIALPFIFLGILPLLFGYTGFPELLGLQKDYLFGDIGLGFLGKDNLFFGFKVPASGVGIVGPFGVGSLLLSLFLPFAFSLFFALSFSLKTKELIKARDETKLLEKEFTSSLFTLGNRIGDGTPAEIAFARVADSSKGLKTEKFFNLVNINLQQMGMSLEDAIFNEQRGALRTFPSALVATSMRILIESVKKSLQVAAQSLMSISEYVKNIHKINERLKDLLAEIVSDMSGNMTFLAPLLSGIVVGLTSMITGILGRLKDLTEGLEAGGDSALGSFGNLASFMNQDVMIPPYFMQIAIGIYIIQVVFILTGTLVTIDAGEDKLKKTYTISRNLIRATTLYLITALGSIIALTILTNVALKSLI